MVDGIKTGPGRRLGLFSEDSLSLSTVYIPGVAAVFCVKVLWLLALTEGL
jgi:hypothetical protein